MVRKYFVIYGTSLPVGGVGLRKKTWRLSASWGPIEAPPETTRPITALYRIEEFKWGSSIGPPLYRETPVSRTADVRFSSLAEGMRAIFVSSAVREADVSLHD